jgi:hypothetical protein
VRAIAWDSSSAQPSDQGIEVRLGPHDRRTASPRWLAPHGGCDHRYLVSDSPGHRKPDRGAIPDALLAVHLLSEQLRLPVLGACC